MDIIHLHMKTLLHSGASHLMTLIYALALSGILPACTDDADRDLPDSGKGGTVTLELSLSVPPVVETKAVICEADSASEARKAGFYYEMQVQTTDTTGNTGGHVATKAASSLKNIYAFLFKISDGKFNGRASIKESVNLTEKLKLVFSDVTDVNSRLVIIANDAVGADYKSSTDFDSFTGTYAEFQKLTLESDIIKDEDIPYVGSTTVSLDDGNFTLSDAVPLYRMLAKIVLHNNTFDIQDGPARDSINLHKAGNKYFGTPNGYDGAGNTLTTAERYSTTATVGKNENTNTWYVGENVQTTDSTNAAYIELVTDVIDISNRPEDVGVGEEYIPSGGEAYKYKVYLKDYALRRNNVYTVRVNVRGDLAYHQTLASTPGSNVSKEFTGVHGGLNIGMYGGAEGYTSGKVDATTISGTYTKYLLLQPNTSGTTDPDNVYKKWAAGTGTRQPDTRKYWDPTYTLADDRIDKGVGYAYDYCNNLTIGNVPAGTWYLPTRIQLQAIYGIWGGIKNNSSYENYFAFGANGYWSATECIAANAWRVDFNNGYEGDQSKTSSFRVRCVRDLPLPILSAQTVTTDSGNHPVIDLSALQPSGIALSFAEASDRRELMNKETPSNGSYLSGKAAVSGENGTWNAQMSGKFQVMYADHTGGTTDWATAYNRCKNYNGEGSSAAGEWRLPTQRELAQIMILHPQLIGKGNFKALTTNICYWTLTENTSMSAWVLDTTFWKIGYSTDNKDKSYRVRCIRDVE